MRNGLEVVDLRKSFNAPNGERIEVLRGVTFTVRPGECVAITGASGSWVWTSTRPGLSPAHSTCTR